MQTWGQVFFKQKSDTGANDPNFMNVVTAQALDYLDGSNQPNGLLNHFNRNPIKKKDTNPKLASQDLKWVSNWNTNMLEVMGTQIHPLNVHLDSQIKSN